MSSPLQVHTILFSNIYFFFLSKCSIYKTSIYLLHLSKGTTNMRGFLMGQNPNVQKCCLYKKIMMDGQMDTPTLTLMCLVGAQINTVPQLVKAHKRKARLKKSNLHDRKQKRTSLTIQRKRAPKARAIFLNRELRKNNIFGSGRTRFQNSLEIIFNFDSVFHDFSGFFRCFCSFS